MENIIEIKNLSKSYYPGKKNCVRALREISLEVRSGEFLTIQGVSGSGKSTLLHIIGALDDADSGTAIVDGQDLSKLSSVKRARFRNETIGFVLQDFGLIPYRTVMDNVAVPLLIHQKVKGKVNSIVNEVLEKLHILDLKDRRITELSGGQKQRVAIARALVNQPTIILADEPTGALDSETKKEIMGVFKEISADGRTIVMVTHDDEIAKMADRRVHICDGRITEDE